MYCPNFGTLTLSSDSGVLLKKSVLVVSNHHFWWFVPIVLSVRYILATLKQWKKNSLTPKKCVKVEKVSELWDITESIYFESAIAPCTINKLATNLFPQFRHRLWSAAGAAHLDRKYIVTVGFFPGINVSDPDPTLKLGQVKKNE